MKDFKNFKKMMEKIGDTSKNNNTKLIAWLDSWTPNRGSISVVNKGDVMPSNHNPEISKISKENYQSQGNER